MAASKQKKDDPFVVTFEERGDQTIVRKSNDLVQMTRNNLTLSQQRLMLHIFSMIKPEDTDLPSYELRQGAESQRLQDRELQAPAGEPLRHYHR